MSFLVSAILYAGPVILFNFSTVWISAAAVSSIAGVVFLFFFFSSRRRHTRSDRDWSSDVCSSDLEGKPPIFTKINGKVLYAMEDIEDFEQISRRRNTSDLPANDDPEGL